MIYKIRQLISLSNDIFHGVIYFTENEDVTNGA